MNTLLLIFQSIKKIIKKLCIILSIIMVFYSSFPVMSPQQLSFTGLLQGSWVLISSVVRQKENLVFFMKLQSCLLLISWLYLLIRLRMMSCRDSKVCIFCSIITLVSWVTRLKFWILCWTFSLSSRQRLWKLLSVYCEGNYFLRDRKYSAFITAGIWSSFMEEDWKLLLKFSCFLKFVINSSRVRFGLLENWVQVSKSSIYINNYLTMFKDFYVI